MGETTDKIKKYRRLFPQLLLLCITSLTLVMGIVIVCNSTLGWFAANRQVSGEAMNIMLNAPAAEADYTVYIYDAKLSCVRYTGDGGENEPTIENLKMQIHDVIFKSRNRYTPAVVRIHLSRIDEAYRGGGTLNVTLGRDDSPAYVIPQGSSVQSLPEKSTSVLRFTLASNSAWYDADADTLYSNIDNALYAPVVLNQIYTGVDSKVFTTVTGEGSATVIRKEDSITLSLAYSASDVSNDGEMDAYLYITYDQGLVDRYEHAEGIDTGGTAVGKVSTMLNDITDFVVSFSAGS